MCGVRVGGFRLEGLGWEGLMENWHWRGWREVGRPINEQNCRCAVHCPP